MIDWNRRVCSKHSAPRHGELLPPEPGSSETRRRVMMPNRHQYIQRDERGAYDFTIYLYREDGTLRCDGAPSEFDLVNAE